MKHSQYKLYLLTDKRNSNNRCLTASQTSLPAVSGYQGSISQNENFSEAALHGTLL